MKKYVLILIVFVALALAGAYVKLFTKQTSYHETIAATTNSVLVVHNLDKSKVRIVAGGDDEIKVDLSGPSEDILSILRAEAGLYTTLDFSDDTSEVSGTITVPQGMILDISLSGPREVTVEDIGGRTQVSGEDSFLVDTRNLSSLSVDSFGNILIDSPGDLTVWDDEAWDVLDGNANEMTGQLAYCGIGSQAIRDYCCETRNQVTQWPACEGIPHWIFDNAARECAFVCDPVSEDTAGDDEDDDVPLADCGVGSQVERNTCCAEQHVGEYQGCIGSWRYNAASQSCEFKCDIVDGVIQDSDDGGDSTPFSYGDPVSDYCADIMSKEDRDQCCDDTLKNALSSGPRPGFPDCIGKWRFDVKEGCHFECAEHAEMMEILNEIRQGAQ